VNRACLDTGLDCGAVVTDQSNRTSLHPAMMAYVVGGDACDVGSRVVCELLGPRLLTTGH